MLDNDVKKQKILFFSITALGISSIITQILVIREFLNVFYGNELVLGIILANWLLLTGFGSYLGKYMGNVKRKFELLIFSQITIALLPIFYIFVIRYMRTTIFLPGLLVNVTQIFLSSFIMLLPYCIISGYLLVLVCCVFTSKKEGTIGKVYFIDNIGDILGGFLFSFILIYFLNPFQTAFFIMFVNLTAALLLSRFINKKILFVFILLLMLSLVFILKLDLNEISMKIMFKGQNVIYHKNSLYGNLVVTKVSEQLNFFENGMPLFSTQNTIANEETVHYAMIQHDDPKKVLLISGGVSGIIDEILKYDVDEIDYVELDPLIIDVGKKFTTNLDNEKVNVIKNMDGRLFIKTTRNRYDVVITDLPDPMTAQVNRFYTVEFFENVKEKLNENGVISMSLSSSENYMNIESRKLNSVLYKTLKSVFKNVIIIPGDENFFIASDSDLTYEIGEEIAQKNIPTFYVNSYYLSGKITEDRINSVFNSVREDVEVNRDFNPVSYYYHLLYWLSHFKVNLMWLFGLWLVVLLMFLMRTERIPFAVFTTGFAASGLEVVILIGFQVLYGYVYHNIGIIVTMFMVGLAIGSYYMNKNLRKKTKSDMVKIELMIFCYSIVLPLILIMLNSFEDKTFIFLSSQILFPVLVMIIAFLVGMEFPLASRLHFEKIAETAGKLYSSDLIGASLGAISVSTLLIPTFGLVKVCFLIGILNLISGMILFFK